MWLDADTAMRSPEKSINRRRKQSRRGDLTERLIKSCCRSPSLRMISAEPRSDRCFLGSAAFFSFARLHAKASGLLSYGPYQQMIV